MGVTNIHLNRSVSKSIASEPPTPAFPQQHHDHVCGHGTSKEGKVVEGYIDKVSLSFVNSPSAKECIVGYGSLMRGSVSSRDHKVAVYTRYIFKPPKKNPTCLPCFHPQHPRIVQRLQFLDRNTHTRCLLETWLLTPFLRGTSWGNICFSSDLPSPATLRVFLAIAPGRVD